MTRRLTVLLFSLPVFLAVAMLLLSTGCGGKKKKSSDSDSDSDAQTSSSDNSSGIGVLQSARWRAADANNLKQMALAMHNYESAYGKLPPAATCDPTGKPLLSWRVEILPYVEQMNLYNQFKRDEPWDSPTNKPLLAQMPKLYLSPGRSKDGDTTTYYRVFASDNPENSLQPIFIMPVAGKGKPPGRSFIDIQDGTSNTILIAEAEEGVPWTKPDELIYDPKKPIPKLSFFYNGVSQIALADGSVVTMKQSITEERLRNGITINDGKMLGAGW